MGEARKIYRPERFTGLYCKEAVGKEKLIKGGMD